MDGGEFDDDILETAIDRKGVLSTLAEEPHHRRELQEAFDVSKTTSHRIIRSFDEKGLVRRTESGYDLTLLGQIIATEVDRFEDSLETAYELEPLLELFESSDEAPDHSLITDPTVDWAVNRDQALIDSGVDRVENADTLRVLDWTPVPDLYIERIFTIMIERGISSEAVYPRGEIQDRLETFPDLHDELLETGDCHRYWVYEDVPPWGMTLYDDSLLELRAYEQDTGAYVLDAVSSDDAAVQWGMDVFAEYRDRADPVTDVDDLAEWGDYSCEF